MFFSIKYNFSPSTSLSKRGLKCTKPLPHFTMKVLQNFKKVPELGGRTSKEDEHENSVLAVKIPNNFSLSPFPFSFCTSGLLGFCLNWVTWREKWCTISKYKYSGYRWVKPYLAILFLTCWRLVEQKKRTSKIKYYKYYELGIMWKCSVLNRATGVVWADKHHNIIIDIIINTNIEIRCQ